MGFKSFLIMGVCTGRISGKKMSEFMLECQG